MAGTQSGVGSGSTTTDSSSSSGKKARKPYTITKSRESWSDEEHDTFLEALHLFGRDWKRIGDYVSSKTVIQIRSHAQKYFLKIQKNGAMAHVPPPRPKRKAAHPYTYKAIKNAMIHHSTLSCVTAGLSQWDESVMPMNIASNGRMCSQDSYTNFNVFEDSTDIASESVPSLGNSSFNGGGSPCLTPPNLAMPERGSLRNGMPDFAVIYTFIGSVFDPDTKDHLRELKEMDPINLRTVLLMMRNLTINMSSTGCETIGEVGPSDDANGEDQDTRGVITTNNNSYYVPSVLAPI